MGTFEQWDAEFTPILNGFVAALGHCDATCERRWAPALLANADQLRAASRSLVHWSSEHPCPNPDFDVVLARVARSYAYAAHSVESVSRGSTTTWLVVERELKGLHAMVAKVITLLYEQAQPGSGGGPAN